MREIKFRAWTGFKMEHSVLAGAGGHYFHNPDQEWITRLSPYTTVMHFTGLTDKNGTPIFEGDIVEWETDNVGGTSRMAVTIEPEDGIVRTFPYVNSTTEVIGNIYESPDLLTREGES